MHNKVWLQGRTGTMYIAAARSKLNLISLKAQGAFSTLSIETTGRSLPSLVKECSLKISFLKSGLTSDGSRDGLRVPVLFVSCCLRNAEASDLLKHLFS